MHLVDFANRFKISINDLKQWSNLYSNLPFQAIEFIIANVKASPEVTQKEATAALAHKILKKQLQAVVIQNVGDIAVRLYDDCGDDVGKFLKEQKWAESRNFEITLSDENNVFPQ